MCGRYVFAKESNSLQGFLEKKFNSNVTKWVDKETYCPSYNAAPGQYQPLIRADNNNEIIMQNMKWGLIPFWTKTFSDYSNIINCRDDSLLDGNKSMFTSMKNSKRCIIIAEGFYEWLKKGNQRLPYYIRRKDGELMLFAGLYDCVTFESSEEKEETGKDKLYTFTIITTSSSKPLSFLHDRMPVILNDEKSLVDWLDADKRWSPDLETFLKPYGDELEIYPVSQDVGKVTNNSPELIVPINSPQSKTNIANYFTKKEVEYNKIEVGDGETDVNLMVENTTGEEPSSSPKLESSTSNRRNFDNREDGKDKSNETSSITPKKIKAKRKQNHQIENSSNKITQFFRKLES